MARGIGYFIKQWNLIMEFSNVSFKEHNKMLARINIINNYVLSRAL